MIGLPPPLRLAVRRAVRRGEPTGRGHRAVNPRVRGVRRAVLIFGVAVLSDVRGVLPGQPWTICVFPARARCDSLMLGAGADRPAVVKR